MSEPSQSLHEALATLTLALCAVPSVTGEEQHLADEVERWLGPSAFQTERVGHSVAALLPRQGLPLITLVGHLDTVPPQPSQSLKMQDGRVYGLGASDMKAGLALMFKLVRMLDPARLRYDLGLVFYEGEEGPFAGNGLEPLMERVGWLGETALAIILEPSSNQPQLGCLGTLHARVVFTGRGAHSARPWHGDNAIYQALPLLRAVADWRAREVWVEGFPFRETLEVTTARGGRARNMVPDSFALNLNHRFAPGVPEQEAVARVERLVAGQAQVEITDLAPAAQVGLSSPLLASFVDHLGVAPAPKQAWTDVARFSARGIPALNWGPGLGSQAHQPNEFAEVGLMVEGYRALFAFLQG